MTEKRLVKLCSYMVGVVLTTFFLFVFTPFGISQLDALLSLLIAVPAGLVFTLRGSIVREQASLAMAVFLLTMGRHVSAFFAGLWNGFSAEHQDVVPYTPPIESDTTYTTQEVERIVLRQRLLDQSDEMRRMAQIQALHEARSRCGMPELYVVGLDEYARSQALEPMPYAVSVEDVQESVMGEEDSDAGKVRV